MRNLILVSLLFAWGPTLRAQSPVRYGFEVVHSYPHDAAAFTQGLEFRDGYLYEGTGLKGRSSLRKVRLDSGEVVRKIDLSPEFFGEGITVVGDEVLQVTWQSEVGFVYRLSDFGFVRRFSYKGEGWGLTSNGHGDVFLSDGTSEIKVLDAKTLAEKRRIRVTDGDSPVDQLNELEFVDGELFANVWLTDRIVRISPDTGKVTGWVDLRGVGGPEDRAETGAVLNGIAYDSATKRLFVTGKLWPHVFEIRLVPAK